jgi:N6-adenosine-specific RNA methylase IME4
MSIQELCRFMAEQVRPIMAESGAVGLWVTNHHMRHAFQLLHALGIDQHSTIVTWVKDKMGRGQVRRDKTEHCIIGLWGKPVLTLTNQTTELRGPRRENSRKPDEFYAEFEAVHPAPRYAEIFSRGGRGANWDCHGDQVGKFAPAAAPDETDVPGGRTLEERLLVAEITRLGGHVVSNTIDHAQMERVATCQCGGFEHRVPFRADPELVLARQQDAAVREHWREMLRQALQQQASAPAPYLFATELACLEAIAAGQQHGHDPEVLAKLVERKLVKGKALKRALSKSGEAMMPQLQQMERRRLALAELPDDIEALIKLYRAALEQRHAALLSTSENAETEAFRDRLGLIEEKADAGFTGRWPEEPPSERLLADNAAPIGEIPIWGQRGMFRLMIDDVPYLVSCDESGGVAVYAADPEKPFLSSTGYRSFYAYARGCAGKTVDQWMGEKIREAIAEATKTKGKKPKALPFPDTVHRLPTSWSEKDADIDCAPIEVRPGDTAPVATPAGGERSEAPDDPALPTASPDDAGDIPDFLRRDPPAEAAE